MTETLFDLAAEIILDHAREVGPVSIAKVLADRPDLDGDHDAMRREIENLINTAQVSVQWPEPACDRLQEPPTHRPQSPMVEVTWRTTVQERYTAVVELDDLLPPEERARAGIEPLVEGTPIDLGWVKEHVDAEDLCAYEDKPTDADVEDRRITAIKPADREGNRL